MKVSFRGLRKPLCLSRQNKLRHPRLLVWADHLYRPRDGDTWLPFIWFLLFVNCTRGLAHILTLINDHESTLAVRDSKRFKKSFDGIIKACKWIPQKVLIRVRCIIVIYGSINFRFYDSINIIIFEGYPVAFGRCTSTNFCKIFVSRMYYLFL